MGAVINQKKGGNMYDKSVNTKLFYLLLFLLLLGGYQNCNKKGGNDLYSSYGPDNSNNNKVGQDQGVGERLSEKRFCVTKYDSQGCNLCGRQPDNTWVCTKKGCIPDTEEEERELDNRANQCVLYRRGDKLLGDSLINEYCTVKYDSQGCNLCTQQPDNTWVCTKKGCVPKTKKEELKLEWRSNLCVGYAFRVIDNDIGNDDDNDNVISTPGERGG